MSSEFYSDSSEDDYYHEVSEGREEEEDDVEKKNPGLDMSHGFIYHIRKNQIDRDNYHKMMMERNQQRSRRQRQKNPATTEGVNVYRPRKALNDAAADTRTESLFRLMYTDRHKKTHLVVVKRNDDATKVARCLQRKADIPEELLNSLIWKINSEKRRNS